MINQINRLILLMMASLVSIYGYAQVESVSSETYAQYGKDAYWEAAVTCTNIDEPRVIQRNADWSGDWCGKAITSVCATEKNDMADKVCSNSYTIELDQIEQTEREEQAELDRQKTEQQRITNQKRQQQRIANQKKEIGQTQGQQGLANNILIEEQIIAIELEKLELRKKELELESRAAEIEELLNKEAQ